MFSFIVTMIILIAVVNIIKNNKNDQQKKNERQKQWDWANSQSSDKQAHGSYQSSSNTQSSKNAGPNAQHRAQNARRINIPVEPARRGTIVEIFSRTHDLNLTEHQISSIVNASYLSEGWASEIEAMKPQYPIRSIWMQGPTAWLRAYLHAFIVQDITSDFIQQSMIAEAAFEEVMNYSDTLEGITMTERIDLVNAKFMTQFDDISFMTAFRFLQSRGHIHKLEHARPGMSDDAEELEKKYMNDEKKKGGSEDPGMRRMGGSH